MKEVTMLLLIALTLNGCSSSTQTVQTAAGGLWQAKMAGGIGVASGFSFNTQLTVGSDGSLSISSFQFLTEGTCFPISGGSESGSMILTINSSTNAVTGTFSFMVQSGNNILTLSNGVVTGTESGTTLSGGSITGSWAVTGSTDCTAQGTFTMTQLS